MVEFYAGMVPTADEFQSLVPIRVVQGTTQSRVSAVGLIDTAISVPIDGLADVRLDCRWGSGGGGIRWAWRVTGSVQMLSRTILSAGSATTTTESNHNIADLRHRQIATPGEEQAIAHYSMSGAQAIQEWLTLDGQGELVFQFGQHTSNAGATTVHGNSVAVRYPLRAV